MGWEGVETSEVVKAEGEATAAAAATVEVVTVAAGTVVAAETAEAAMAAEMEAVETAAGSAAAATAAGWPTGRQKSLSDHMHEFSSCRSRGGGRRSRSTPGRM